MGHIIFFKKFLSTGISKNDYTVVDDCTNVHFESDLKKASIRLKK